MRGKQAKKRKIEPDMIYNSKLVTKFINCVMQDGKKTKARDIVYKAIKDAAKKLKMDELEMLETAIVNIQPKMEVRSRRIGGANFQVPVPVPANRQRSLAIRWIIDAARQTRGNRDFWESLSGELMNSVKKEGSAYKKKEDMHRMAEANKAFAQFA